MDEKTYPDIAPFLAAKAAQRRQLAARSWEEKVAIIEQMRESMPRHGWRKAQSAPDEAAGRLRRYRAIVEEVLITYAQSAPQGDATDERRACQPIFDERQDIYLVQCLRCEHGRCEFMTPVRLRIEDNRIVIEADESQGGMVAALMQAGIPADDVVERLVRPHTTAS